MRRPAITIVFLGLAALLVTEGFVVFRFLKNAADATQLVAVERQIAHEASGITRKVMAQARSRQDPAEREPAGWVSLQDDNEAESPEVTAPGLNVRSHVQ